MPPDSKADVNDRVKSWILRPDAKCSASMRARLRGIYCKKSHTKRGKLVIAPNSAGKSYLCRGNPEFIDQDNVLPPWLRKAPRTDLVIQLIVAVSLYFVVTQGRIVVGECWWHPSEVDLFWQPHLDTILERCSNYFTIYWSNKWHKINTLRQKNIKDQWFWAGKY